MKKLSRTYKIFLLLLLILFWKVSAGAETKRLVILTTNDLHGQVEPLFTTGENETTVEMGGFSRLASAVRSIKEKYPAEVLVVNSGDSLTGKYFLQFKGEAVFSALTLMGIDAGTLGNHEFDRGADILAAALKYCRFPVVETNLKPITENPLAGLFVDAVVMQRNSLKIGILGLMTPVLPLISNAKGLKFAANMAERARSAAEKLKKEQKADLVIALTHIGLEEDKALARKVPQIDVICGSHSHDLLKTGQEVVLLRPDGSRTIIVQAGARGQYLGLLKLELENGLIMGHQWEPIRVGATIIQAPDMEDLIRMYQKKMPLKRVLTTSRVALDCLSETVRAREAAIGNLITDIIRQRFNTDMAFHNGGGIRGERVIPAGRITTEDIDTMLPFENRVVLLRLKGRVIKQALERGVAFLSPKQGAFLQVSGLRYEVNPKATPQKLRTDKNRIPIGIRQPGSRIVNMEVLQKEGRYQPLDSERVYAVAVNSFLANGGDGYVMLKAARHRTATYVPLRSAVTNRLDRSSFIAPKQEGRIRILD